MSYDSASNVNKPAGSAYNLMEPDPSNHSQHSSEISGEQINNLFFSSSSKLSFSI